jgi:hypothetical protein
MKNLKYIKLFEAFESSKISKTLAFINKDSKQTFIEKLNNLAKSIDFPVSELSDKFLQYLPFKKALELNANIEDSPCTATSKGQFSDSGIDGEKCESGMIKRKWGRSIRTVGCPNCHGTGIEPKTNFSIKWVKFWFDKDGNYVQTSVTDGKVRSQSDTVSDKLSQNLSDYEVVKELTLDELKNLTTGDYVKITLTDGSGRTVIGRVFKYDRNTRSIYIIQNFSAGSEPDYSSAWKKFGKFSWVIDSGSEYTGMPILLKPRTVEKDERPNPYTWNALLGRNYTTVESDSDMKSKLSKAHFAIVVDYLELSQSKFIKRSDIQTKRKEQTTGALSLQSDEEIRKQNINRYIEEINKRVQFSSDFSNVKNLIFRLFGLGKFGYYVLRGSHFSDFDNIITYMFRFLKSGDDHQEFYYERIVGSLKPRIKSNIEFNRESDDIMKSVFLSQPDYIKPLQSKFEELNAAIYNRFKSFNLESIEDIEIFFEKMKSLRSLWRDSQRFENLRNTVYYPIENMSDKWRLERYLSQIGYSQVDSVIEDIDRFISVVNKI